MCNTHTHKVYLEVHSALHYFHGLLKFSRVHCHLGHMLRFRSWHCRGRNISGGVCFKCFCGGIFISWVRITFFGFLNVCPALGACLRFLVLWLAGLSSRANVPCSAGASRCFFLLRLWCRSAFWSFWFASFQFCVAKQHIKPLINLVAVR